MTASIQITRAGLLSTIQDKGRRGLRHLGIPWSGCLVPAWQQLANTLVGNSPDHCIVECWEGGLQMTVLDNAVRVAVMADPTASLKLETSTGTQRMKAMRSYTIEAGDTIVVNSTGNLRLAVVSIAGVVVAPHLGSRSTYAKAGLGGICGNVLQQDDKLITEHSPKGPELACSNPLDTAYGLSTLRVVMGPQDDHFSDDGRHQLLSGSYELSSEADRMGARLSGPEISHRDDSSKDIVSDAIVPGSIQVPGNGQPIVLLGDAHTAGGYPKIATVISIDLPLLALQRPGTTFTFSALSIDDAISATRAQHQLLHQAINDCTVVTDALITTETLLTHNLIDGVTDGEFL